MKSLLRYFSLLLVMFMLLSCESNDTLRQPTELQQKWMEQSWLEFIVEVKSTDETFNINKVKSKLPIEKIKPFSKTQFVITLNKKTKFKVIYNELMQYRNVKSIQPNFIYQIPKSVIN